MEEANSVGGRIVDEHAFCVAGYENFGGEVCVIGERNGRVFTAKAGVVELAAGPVAQTSLLFADLLVLISWVRHFECDGGPGRCRPSGSFGGQAGRAPAQGEEGYAGGIQAVEIVIGAELGIENEMLRYLAVMALPEGDEAENLVGLPARANVGIGVPEHLAIGILGQEGEDAPLGGDSALEDSGIRPADVRRSNSQSAPCG